MHWWTHDWGVDFGWLALAGKDRKCWITVQRMKLRIEKGEAVCWNARFQNVARYKSNGTCVSLLTNSKDQRTGVQPSLRIVKWWGPVAEIGSSMRFL